MGLSKSILVTGACGFVGRRLVKVLVEAGWTVTGVDRSLPKVETEGYGGRFTFVQGDLTTDAASDQIERQSPDVVVHLAAAGVKASHREWRECVATNVGGTERLLRAVGRLSRRPRLVYAQTFYEDYVDSVAILRDDPYVVTKRAASGLVSLWAETTGAPVTFAKLFQVYGPGDDPGNVLSYAVGRLREKKPAVFRNGDILRDWIYLDDIVDALVCCVEAGAEGVHRYDLGTGRLTSLREMVEILAGQMGCTPALTQFERQGGGDDFQGSAFARNPVPGWRPRFTCETGLEQLVRLSA